MDKKEIADTLDQISVFLDILGENPFKARAYSSASRALAASPREIKELVENKELTDIKGIGKSIAEHITAKILYDRLGIKSIGELEYACSENRLVQLEGFGAKSQQNILDGIARLKKYKAQFLFSDALPIAVNIEEALRSDPNIIRASVAGSLRRRKETVKDIDVLASAKKPQKAMELFTRLPAVEKIVASGPTRSSVVFKNGIPADLRIISDKQYPYALHHFTGSKEHNTAMRGRAKMMNLKMNEYGLFSGKRNIPCKDEDAIFKKLSLAYIPPELRENMGEIEAAESGRLPRLIEEKDIKGVFHIHTEMSDGTTGIEPLVQEAKKLGWQFIGISDHSVSAAYAGGLKAAEIKSQHREIDRLNAKFSPFKIYKGIESDIRQDGSLDYPDKVLASFDFVISSVHSKFTMSEKKMTARIIKAIKNKRTTILGHPTGRLLLSREPYPVNIKDVIKAAGDYGTVIELNSHPYRLDIDWREMPYAKSAGVRIIICPDAHNPQGLHDFQYGVWIARKGWMEKDDVLNCLSIRSLDSFLASKH